MPDPARLAPTRVWRSGRLAAGARTVAEETAVAFTFGGSTYAVMMATPRDLEDFAVGFCLTEGIVAAAAEIAGVDIVEEASGVELRIALAEGRAAALAERRRRMAGPVGCGLCGIESLEAALRPLPPAPRGAAVPPDRISAALESLRRGQSLNRETHAVHAAAFFAPAREPAIREDVGRHNALDKLAGALARAGVAASDGFIVMTSRLSVELVQKAAMIGAPILVAVSAPTALAIRTAEAAGITLVAVARADGFEVFTHAERVAVPAAATA